MGVCASRPADKGEAEGHKQAQTGTLKPGGSATVSLPHQGLKGAENDTSSDTADALPVARDSYGTDEIQKPRSARQSLDAAGVSPASTSNQTGDDVTIDDGLAEADISPDAQEILKEYSRLAEMLSYSPYPVTLIDLERTDQPYAYVNEVCLPYTLCVSHYIRRKP